MTSYIKKLKDLLIFKEPKKKEKFIAKEDESESESQNDKSKDSDEPSNEYQPKKRKNEDLLLNKTAPIITGEGEKNKSRQSEKGESKPSEISKDIQENMAYMKKRYTIPDNGDIVLREFNITVKEKVIPAFMIFIDGMTDRKVIDDDILQPLMLLSNIDIKGDVKDISSFIKNQLIPHNQLKEAKTYQDVIDEINFGGCAVFVDDSDIVFTADVKGWEHRTIGRPETEQVIRGPQEGFIETLRANTALVRKILKDEDLIVESITIGRRSKTPCSMLYIKDITNDDIVKEVRRRLKSLDIDYIIDSGELEQLIEDSSIIPSPQIMSTERPDRVAAMLVDGKVAVAMHGSPFVLVMPITNNDLIKSPEDNYVRFPYANLLRYIRVLGVFMSLLLPGLYVAITNFHQEMIPTDLIFAIAASREKVPFPSVVEILIMEVAFELIREAGIRIPGPIGPTLGIIGALILGQAAVAANIVSPILIIVVAVTGIGSFAIPNFSLGFAFRITRFAYIFLGAIAGFLGITAGLFIQGIWLTSAKSFGVPFMAPFGPKTKGGFSDQFMRAPMWKQEERPDYVNPKDIRKQPRISRGWVKSDAEENGDERQ